MKQTELFKKESKSYGGTLMKTRKGRALGRPLTTNGSMHLVLRSSKAIKGWSFKKPKHEKKINEIVAKFSTKYGVRILSLANVGNHLHFHIKLANRHTYRPFIRAITSAIAMAVSGTSRWNKLKIKFWDYRPFTRVLQSWREQLSLKDYVEINQFEGMGFRRATAHYIVAINLPKLRHQNSFG
jgi:REP element-mobilizing transposase RayT